MSVMAGFDLVIEVAKETALRLIQANVQIGATPLSPPFGIDVPVSLGTDSYAAVIVTGMSLDLVGDRGVNVVLKFENTSILSKAPALAITLLDGTVTIGATLELVDFRSADQKVMAANLNTATAKIAFSPAAQSRIAAGIAGLGINTAQLVSIAEAAMQAFVRSAGRQIIPAPVFSVKPGMNGSISQGRFERLVLHNIAGKSIGLFGMLLADKPLGNPADKNSSLIPAGLDICVEIGADAFHRLVFCANLAGTGPVSALPPSCGGGSMVMNGVTFTSFSDSFAYGHIDINGTFKKSGTCYDATGSIHSTVTLSLAQIANKSVVSAHVAVDEPYINVDVPWYCVLAQVVLGPLGLLIADSINSSAKSSAKDLQSAVSSLTGGGLTFGTGMSAAKFKQVSINPEAIVLSGTVAVDLPPPQSPALKLLGSVTTSTRSRLSEGVYVVADGCMAGSYPYLEDAQAQSGTFVTVATLLGKPLNLEWRLECWQGFFGYGSAPKLVSAAILGGASGVAVLDGVTTTFPLPLPGGTSIVQPVHVSYNTTSTSIKVTNLPEEGNYGFMLTVKATDPAGHVATAITGVGFEGDVVAILGDYQAKLAQCIAELLERMKRVSIDRFVIIPPWVPVNYPRPDELIPLIRFLTAAGTPETDQALLHTKLAHASSYLRVINSREVVEGIQISGISEALPGLEHT